MQLSKTNVKTMSSLEIAKMTGKRHSDVLETIRNVLIEADIDSATFSAEYKDKSGKTNVMFYLPRRECDLIIAGYSVKYRLAIIDRWHELEQKQTDKEVQARVRSEMRLEFRPMTDAIVESRNGKEIKSHHFSNECDLLNRIALGATAAQYRRQFDIDDKTPLRDILSKEQSACILSLQRANTVYLLEGLSFDDRKQRLKSLYEKRHAEKLMIEAMNEA